MDKKKEDRRVRITKQAIRESLIEWMELYPIAKISVKMLCERADINRSTFYAHYKDQYDLLGSVQNQVIEEVKKQVFTAQFFQAGDSAVTVLVQILEYGKQNGPLIKVLLSENGDPGFQNELMQLAHEKLMDEFGGVNPLPIETLEYLKRFAVSGLLSIMRYWMERDCQDDPQMIAALMLNLVFYGTHGLVEETKG